jgi:rhodanese-related sulfurtransferase
MRASLLNPSKAMTALNGTEQESSPMTVITREEILARLEEPAFVLVNVTPKETFQDGHIPRSINLPLSDIETKARQFFPDLGRELVIYCGGPT